MDVIMFERTTNGMNKYIEHGCNHVRGTTNGINEYIEHACNHVRATTNMKNKYERLI